LLRPLSGPPHSVSTCDRLDVLSGGKTDGTLVSCGGAKYISAVDSPRGPAPLILPKLLMSMWISSPGLAFS
jgi:hypothetical protein